MVAVSWLIAVYYNVIISHVMYYLVASLWSVVSGLPWTSCGNDWNTEACLEPTSVDELVSHYNNTLTNSTLNGTAPVDGRYYQ